MDLNKKQRLIGIFVLIAVALIAIPSLFEFTYKKSPDNQHALNIPIEPHTPEVSMSETNNEDEIDLTELDEFELNSSQKAPAAKTDEHTTPAAPSDPALIEANLDTSQLNSTATDVVQAPVTPKQKPQVINQAINDELIVPKPHKVEAIKPLIVVKPQVQEFPKEAPKPKAKTVRHDPIPSVKPKKFVTKKLTPPKHPIVSESQKRPVPKTKLLKLKQPNIIVEQKSFVKRPETWTLQLGSFSNKENVTKLIKSLRNKGLSAYTVDTYGQKKTSTRVYVGPYTDKSKADRLAHQISDEFSIHAIIVRNQV